MPPTIQNKGSRLWGQIGRSGLYLVVLAAALGLGWWITPTSVHYRLTEHFVFSSPQQDASVYLAVILPKNGAYQTVENMRIDWDGTQEQVSHPSLDVVKLQGDIQSGETLAAAISYDVILSDNLKDEDGLAYKNGSFNIEAGLGFDMGLVTLSPTMTFGLSKVFKDNPSVSNVDSKYFTYGLTVGINIGDDDE